MMAAVRILIWLRVRLVRRSSISNMAFPLGACSFFERASRLHTAGIENATRSMRRTEGGRFEIAAGFEADPLLIVALDEFASGRSRPRPPRAGNRRRPVRSVQLL